MHIRFERQAIKKKSRRKDKLTVAKRYNFTICAFTFTKRFRVSHSNLLRHFMSWVGTQWILHFTHKREKKKKSQLMWSLKPDYTSPCMEPPFAWTVNRDGFHMSLTARGNLSKLAAGQSAGQGKVRPKGTHASC